MPEARIEIPTDDGCLEAFVACPDGQGRRPAILLLADRPGVTPDIQTRARHLAARGYFVLAPEWARRPADDRREDAEAWFDHLGDTLQADDARVGVLGYGAGADLALRLAAWRAERVAAVAAYAGHGVGPVAALDLAQRINGVVRLGYRAGHTPSRAAALEAALCAAGVDFDVEVYAGEPDWNGLVDLFARALTPPQRAQTEISPLSINP